MIFRLLLDDPLEPLDVTTWRKSLKLWEILLPKFTRCTASAAILFCFEDLFAVVGLLGGFCTILIILGGLRRSCRLRRFFGLFFFTPIADIHVPMLTTMGTGKRAAFLGLLRESIIRCRTSWVGDQADRAACGLGWMMVRSSSRSALTMLRSGTASSPMRS